MFKPNDPCVCGHSYSAHSRDHKWRGSLFCLMCTVEGLDPKSQDFQFFCDRFILDNLKFIENTISEKELREYFDGSKKKTS